MSSRTKTLTVCSVLVVALLVIAAFAPLPMTIASPGLTANVLGSIGRHRVITITGTPTRTTSGELRMVTIGATAPNASVHLLNVVRAWFARNEAVMPSSAVYPGGGTTQQIEQQNSAEMKQSQDAATAAALRELHLSPTQVKVSLQLANVGGPSAGLMFTLGIIDMINGNGRGGDLTSGRRIAGTGTITAGGAVGAVGGVALKEQAAKRDGATVFLVPRAECADAKALLPTGLQLIPVSTLGGALTALQALDAHAAVPSC